MPGEVTVSSSTKKDGEFVHEEGRAVVEGTLGAVQGDIVPHLDVTSALHVQVLAVLGQDETARGDGGHLGRRDLRHGLIVQDRDLFDGQLLNALVSIAQLLDDQVSATFHGTALDQDCTGTGQVDDTAGDVVGHGDGDLAHPLPRHRIDMDPIFGRIHRPGTVGIDLDGLRRGILRLEDEDVLAGGDGPGLHVLFRLLTAGKGQEGRQARYDISYLFHIHLLLAVNRTDRRSNPGSA